MAGLRVAREAASAALSPAVAARGAELILTSGILGMRSAGNPPETADRFVYELEFEYEGQTGNVTVGEAALPPRVRALTDWLQSL